MAGTVCVFEVEGALLVVCYRDGRQAHTLYMSRDQCNAYWKQWLLRLHTFYSMQLKQGR